MPSSYNVLKSTVIQSSEVVSPPIIERIFESEVSKESGENNFNNVASVYETITSDAEKRRDDIIREAEDRAREIIDNALAGLEEIKAKSAEEGYQDGYKKGYKDGYDYGLVEAAEEAEKIKESAYIAKQETDMYIKHCDEEIKNYIKDNEKQLIHLAVNIARSVLNTEVTLNPDAIYKMAEKVISKSIDKRQVILKVNPSDFNVVKNRKEELSIYVEDPNNIIVIADSSINKGSIMAETPSGFIDGDINSQLDMVLNSLLGE